MQELSLLTYQYFEHYTQKQKISLQKHFDKLQKKTLSTQDFSFYLTASAVYSSMIEGNNMNLENYLKFSHSGINQNSKSYLEVKHLESAYFFAQSHSITLENFLQAHKILSVPLLQEVKYQGAIRNKNVFVFKGFEKIYTGASPENISTELQKLFTDIQNLLQAEISINEVFYFASMIHLKTAQIHPFADGNGRSARLLEKWFLASKLGQKSWLIQSERLYYERLKSYYQNINLGENYKSLNMDFSLPFLLMLPMALKLSKNFTNT